MHWDYTIALQSKLGSRTDPKLPGQTIRLSKPFYRGIHDRYVVEPSYENQRSVFINVLDKAFEQGGWTVYFDELYYIEDQLRMKQWENKLLTQGRSKGLTVMVGMQRPVGVTRFALSQSTHIISFSMEGRDVAQTLRQTATEALAETVTQLKRYEFAWYYKPTREIWTGRVQDLISLPKAKTVT
jgi:hypothetical protein